MMAEQRQAQEAVPPTPPAKPAAGPPKRDWLAEAIRQYEAGEKALATINAAGSREQAVAHFVASSAASGIERSVTSPDLSGMDAIMPGMADMMQMAQHALGQMGGPLPARAADFDPSLNDPNQQEPEDP